MLDRRRKHSLLELTGALNGGSVQLSYPFVGQLPQRRRLAAARATAPFLSTNMECEGRGASAQLIGYVASVKGPPPPPPPPPSFK